MSPILIPAPAGRFGGPARRLSGGSLPASFLEGLPGGFLAGLAASIVAAETFLAAMKTSLLGHFLIATQTTVANSQLSQNQYDRNF
jgi:hypothetical protein